MLFQTENETESNKKLREISFKSMLVESLDLIAVLFSAILTHSMIAWFDLAGAFNAELHSDFAFPKYEWSLYISPVATVLLSCFFIIGNVRRIKKSFNELVSTAVPSAQQDEIIDILLKLRSEYVERIGEIKCYNLNHKLNIAVRIEYKKDTTYQQQMQLLQTWKEAINERYPESIVSIELEECR